MTEHYQLSNALKNDIDHWVHKFPEGRQASAVIPALTLVQDQEGYLSEDMMNAVANHLQMPYIAVYEVVTFYTMFRLKPSGKHQLEVCTNISCMLRGCNQIVDHLKEKLDIDFNETSKNGLFTLRSVECLGSCGTAPVMKLGKDYVENLTVEKIDTLLNELEAKA
jgi:NADH-quinone oxidoreductase subunit E